MKALSIIVFCLFCCASCTAQRITLADLKYVLYHNLDECGNYLNKRGFNLKSIDSSTIEAYYMVSYHYTKNESLLQPHIEITKKSTNKVFNEVNVLTFNKKDYSNIKKSIELLKFESLSVEPLDERSIIQYIKGNLFIQFVITKGSPNNISYLIEVRKFIN